MSISFPSILPVRSSAPRYRGTDCGRGSGQIASPIDVNSRRYLHKVTEALLNDRYSLVATRDIESGEEFTNEHSAEDDCPPYYDVLYEQYGVREDFLDAS